MLLPLDILAVVFPADCEPATSFLNELLYPTNTSTSCCTWQGVTCTSGFVSKINVDGLGLSGSINGTALSKLTNLQYLKLSNNEIKGNIGSNLPQTLRYLDISNTLISGVLSLPPFIQFIDISNTHIYGSLDVPNNVVNLNASYTYIYSVGFSTSVPPAICDLRYSEVTLAALNSAYWSCLMISTATSGALSITFDVANPVLPPFAFTIQTSYSESPSTSRMTSAQIPSMSTQLTTTTTPSTSPSDGSSTISRAEYQSIVTMNSQTSSISSLETSLIERNKVDAHLGATSTLNAAARVDTAASSFNLDISTTFSTAPSSSSESQILTDIEQIQIKTRIIFNKLTSLSNNLTDDSTIGSATVESSAISQTQSELPKIDSNNSFMGLSPMMTTYILYGGIGLLVLIFIGLFMAKYLIKSPQIKSKFGRKSSYGTLQTISTVKTTK
eukprot:NODE_70_length_24940_cov_0.663138.p6 type:complete len:443 gc:universal NODE_70_length_24940_cov_0.663138:20221-21549(+)